ncbi:hypothetical protein TKK_0018011 [Trichogramma kaykai]
MESLIGGSTREVKLKESRRETQDIEDRHERFCKLIQGGYRSFKSSERKLNFENMADQVRNGREFPSVSNFFKFALQRKKLDAVMFLQEHLLLNIHEVRFCLDFDLARSLLTHGASLGDLKREMVQNVRYDSNPRHIVETMVSMQSHDYVLDTYTRFGILKFWLKVREDDVTFIESIPSGIIIHLLARENSGFFAKRETLDYLNRYRFLLRKSPYSVCRWIARESEHDIATMKNITIYKDISLYQICQVSYKKGSLILKKVKSRPLPKLHDLKILSPIVKRHLAHILMRTQFEKLVADLFMTEHCKTNLPYDVGLNLAEYMDDDELYRLCELRNEEHI